MRKILVLSPMFGSSRMYYSELLESISKRATVHNYQLLIQPVDIENKLTLDQYYAPLRDISGIIAITCQVSDSEWLSKAKEAGIPVVLIHDNVKNAQLANSSVVSSIQPNLQGLADLANHLILDHGCVKPVVVMVSPQKHSLRKQKLDILTLAFKTNRVEFNPKKQLFIIPEYTIEEGKKVVDQIVKTFPAVDVIISLADTTAIGIQQRLAELKSNNSRVTGFDNLSMAETYDVTSVDQQLKTIGETALIDLSQAIEYQQTHFPITTYIPTTLIKRSSCCRPGLPPSIVSHPLPRFAIYFNIEDQKVLSAIDQMRIKVFSHEQPNLNPVTISLLGKAPLYPPHITFKGIFQLKSKSVLETFVEELKQRMGQIPKFTISVKDLMNYPPPIFLSFGFTEESIVQLRQLQADLLLITNQYRLQNFIEPEFRQPLYSEQPKNKQYTVKYGEPFVKDLFIPHVSIISGIDSSLSYDVIYKLVKTDFVKLLPLKFCVNKISLLFETTLGGKWETFMDFYLRD